MPLVLLLVVLAVLAGIALVAAGRGSGLADVRPDRAPLGLPEGDIEADDLDALRFAVGFRGYRMDQVDLVLDRLGQALATRDARIAELEQAAGVDAERPAVPPVAGPAD